MLFNIIDEKGIFVDIDKLDEPPLIEVEGDLVPDPSYIIEPIPNNIYFELGVSPKWTGSEWVATAEPAEPPKNEPSTDEQLMLAIAELDVQRATDRLETEMAIADLAETMLGGM